MEMTLAFSPEVNTYMSDIIKVAEALTHLGTRHYYYYYYYYYCTHTKLKLTKSKI